MADSAGASSGHKLGQLVGDWFEEHLALPLLKRVAEQLHLYLDHRFHERSSRTGEKIIWKDVEGNGVDYDFVMELGGSKYATGIPVAFFECFWRRGARRSKDKARDDTGKLSPMRDVHPTARFLGIVAGGDFTGPARALVQNRQIDLFYIPKAKIVSAFAACRLQMDYPDTLPETDKAKLAAAFEKGLTPKAKKQIAAELRNLVGEPSLDSYVDRVRAALGAVPQEIRIIAQQQSRPVVFQSISAASEFLDAPQFDWSLKTSDFVYQITYTDGTDFERTLDSIESVKVLHAQIEHLSSHMGSLKRVSR